MRKYGWQDFANAQIWHVPLDFQISEMFLCCVSRSDNSGEACGISFGMRRSKNLNGVLQHLVIKHLQIAT
ncbi:hypothetical protein A9200_11340 [Maribacter hydrothermalis]|uniref:Uncharacterized protein n=1 Tax=Maribacter hydrothermalis TaxID=1836467 RepID=A0A1B7YXE4_9FLAO|nr:hypothetical protein BTR34_05105 [Maribacter hydrothermalis]OBR35162.1 hypothetical protein A9200_11340 [Maribacter hydrothermalis]